MTAEKPVNKLSPADADAFDALVEAGFDCDALPPFLQERARNVATLLGLLDGPPDAISRESRNSLIDAAMAQAAQCSCAPGVASAPEYSLSEADAVALDAIVSANWEPAATADISSAQAQRSERISNLFALLDTPNAEVEAHIRDNRDNLVRSTMYLVRRDAARLDRARRSAEAGSIAGRMGGFRLADLGAVAAILLVAVSIVWPALASAREQSRQLACQSNMQNAGMGFSLYSDDHKGALPRSEASLAGFSTGSSWWNIGDPAHSHSANLFTLITQGYATLSNLACPGNPDAPTNLDTRSLRDWRNSREVSYSYQLFANGHPTWNDPIRVVVLVDRSPVVERAHQGEKFDPLARSLNHRSRGQNVLFNDASVRWYVSPELENGDNIWLPRSLTGQDNAILKGVEHPDATDDAFVGP